jgi:hypothetical protein
MRNSMRLSLLIAVIAASVVLPAPTATACSRYLITNRDYCGSESCPVTVCTLDHEDAANCYYTC